MNKKSKSKINSTNQSRTRFRLSERLFGTERRKTIFGCRAKGKSFLFSFFGFSFAVMSSENVFFSRCLLQVRSAWEIFLDIAHSKLFIELNFLQLKVYFRGKFTVRTWAREWKIADSREKHLLGIFLAIDFGSRATIHMMTLEFDANSSNYVSHNNNTNGVSASCEVKSSLSERKTCVSAARNQCDGLTMCIQIFYDDVVFLKIINFTLEQVAWRRIVYNACRFA